MTREDIDEKDRSIGIMIKEKREYLGLSQEEVAKFVGVSKSAVSRWENGEVKNMGASKIMSLSKILRIPETSFILGPGESYHTIDSFKDPREAMKFILEQPVFMMYGGYDLNSMSDDEILEIANDMLIGFKISVERQKQKKRKE